MMNSKFTEFGLARSGDYWCLVLAKPRIPVATPMTTKQQKEEALRAGFNELKKAIQTDPCTAWAWHCSIACCFIDHGGTHEQANKAAADFIWSAFQTDVKKDHRYKSFDWAKGDK